MSLYVGEGLISGGGAYMLGRGLYPGAELIADINFLLAADARGGGGYKRLIMWGII